MTRGAAWARVSESARFAIRSFRHQPRFRYAIPERGWTLCAAQDRLFVHRDVSNDIAVYRICDGALLCTWSPGEARLIQHFAAAQMETGEVCVVVLTSTNTVFVFNHRGVRLHQFECHDLLHHTRATVGLWQGEIAVAAHEALGMPTVHRYRATDGAPLGTWVVPYRGTMYPSADVVHTVSFLPGGLVMVTYTPFYARHSSVFDWYGTEVKTWSPSFEVRANNLWYGWLAVVDPNTRRVWIADCMRRIHMYRWPDGMYLGEWTHQPLLTLRPDDDRRLASMGLPSMGTALEQRSVVFFRSPDIAVDLTPTTHVRGHPGRPVALAVHGRYLFVTAADCDLNSKQARILVFEMQ